MDPPRLVLVTGATGSVGPRVVHALRGAGCLVRTLSMDACDSLVLPDNVDVRTGDIMDQGAVASALEGVHAVVHLAALLHIADPPHDLKREYERVNVGGTDMIVKSALRAGVGRVVFFSTIAVYGDTQGLILTEDSPTRPGTYYAKTKLDAEGIVLGAQSAEGEPIGVVLRLGAVYGSRIKGNYQALAQALARKRFIPIGDGRNRRTLVYDADAAQAALVCMRSSVAAGKIYNVSDGQFHTVAEIISAICSALGRRTPRYSLPMVPTRLMAGALDRSARLFGGRFAPNDKLAKYSEDVAVSSNRIRVELGFQPQFDLTTGWKETIIEMDSMKIL